MLYRPKKAPVINAFKFDSDRIGTDEYNVLGIERAPKYSSRGMCSCGKPMDNHGFLKSPGLSGHALICPGSYIIYERNVVSSVMGKSNFEEIYEPLIRPEDIVADI